MSTQPGPAARTPARTPARDRADPAAARGSGGAASQPRAHPPVAAVDLGSNSFHMVVARAERGHLRVVDRMRERVVLGAGFDDAGRLTEEAQRRALACIGRFGQRLRDVPRENVRAVGTNALRMAKNARQFLARAERALGHPIEVIPGREEARLIWLGVAHSQPGSSARRLVVDIGGGSTEVIVGERFEPLRTDSLYMGCVSWTLRFFPDGRLTRKAFRRARIAARLEVQTIARACGALGWETCLGSSGTILSIAEALRLHRAEDAIGPAGLRWLRDEMLAAERLDRLEIEGLEPERVQVLPGGLAILWALFDGLGIEEMRPAQGALREGVLYDLVGRIRHEDVRDRTIRAFCERHQVDGEQASRVERTALRFLESAAGPWKLRGDETRSALAWAARLHEIGLTVAYAGHHKHGAYVVQHADMPGFSRQEQEVLAAIVRSHRRRLARPGFAALPDPWRETALRLCVLLRLAVRLNRSRTPRRLPNVKLTVRRDAVSLRFPGGWLDRHPLTRADLEEEAREMSSSGFRLAFR